MSLREVVVLLPIVLASFQVLSLDQLLDALFDEERRRIEARREVAGDFHDERVVIQRLPALHDPHDHRLDEMLPVLFHRRRDALRAALHRLFRRGLQRHQRNLHSEELALK